MMHAYKEDHGRYKLVSLFAYDVHCTMLNNFCLFFISSKAKLNSLLYLCIIVKYETILKFYVYNIRASPERYFGFVLKTDDQIKQPLIK